MKTVFVTLLMIGMAMTGCGQSKPKIAIPAGQFDAATFKGPWPTKKVDCIDLGNNYFNVHYQDGTELHFGDSRPNRDVPPIPDPLPPDVDNADLCAELHADKPAKPSANKAAPITELIGASKCKIVPAGDGCNACTVCDGPNSASMCTTMYCTQKGELEKLLKSPPEPPPNAKPLDVRAIRKTRVIHPKGTCWGEGQNAVCAMQKDDTEDYWDCKDPDAYSLQVSVSGKRANCHRIVP